MRSGRDVEITWDGGSVSLRGRDPASPGLYVSGDGIDGWDSVPDAKVQLTERQSGDGSYPIEDEAVLYSARTVTIGFGAVGKDRDEVKGYLRELSRACSRLVRLRVLDGNEDTFAVGYVEPTVDAEWSANRATGTVTVVCPDPRRYSQAAQTEELVPGTSSAGGLLFDDAGCMLWPVQFGGDGSTQNTATLTNSGTSTAYPVIRAMGSFPYGLRITDGSGGELFYAQPLSWQQLVLDCKDRTAAVNGVDLTRNLAGRDFPSIPPGGSVTLSIQSTGTGSVSVELRDTYL